MLLLDSRQDKAEKWEEATSKRRNEKIATENRKQTIKWKIFFPCFAYGLPRIVLKIRRVFDFALFIPFIARFNKKLSR